MLSWRKTRWPNANIISTNIIQLNAQLTTAKHEHVVDMKENVCREM